jgi:bacillolysin
MKRVLLLIMFIAPALFLNGQNNNFKTRQKNPVCTFKPNISFVKISSKNGSKSASANKYPVSPALPSLQLSTDKKYINKIIRKDGMPVYIEKETNTQKSSGAASFEEKFYLFLEETKPVTGIVDPRKQFKISEILTDNLGITHIKSIQQYKGIDIYGSESTLHFNNQNERYTGSFCKIGDKVPVSPKISLTNAAQKAIGDIKQKTVLKELSTKEKEILHYDSPVSKLVVYSKDNTQYELTWEITIRPNFIEEWKYFVSAETGEIIHCYNNTCSDGPVIGTGYDLNNVQRSVQAYLENGTYYMMNMAEPMYNQTTGEGVILTLDANNTSASNLDYKYVISSDNTWTSKAAVSAHYNAGRTYEYFNNTFGHNSINGDGGNIISLINVAEDDGSSMENAFWNGQAAFYGNGGTNFKPLAGALDVTAHELGHGVVSNTANLEYYGQSGAINESYADIFGSMVDRDDWLIGEDITKTSFSPSGALRNMADPHNMGTSSNSYWQPKHVSEMYLGSDDNGGVHINSGIGNYAYYLYATAVTKDKAENVFYQALDKYLSKTSQFIDFRIAVVQAASDLFGVASQEVVKAGESFDAVGIYEENQVDKTQDYSINPGTEYLLCYRTDNSSSATLAMYNGTSLQTLSNTVMKGKASVTDDGTGAVFVSNDSKIRYISLDPLQPEVIISDQAFWDNVALSKDGKRLAAISTEVDASIYVYDFSSKKWVQFELYNPTTSQFNTDAGGVQYADAIEFDITGEYLIYDACNALSSSSTEDINYWDIGFIKVWDNSKNAFGDGSISKLYGSLPEDVSIGNPVFSKNSPSIIAFDYIDSYAKEYAILGTDLNSGETDLITSNATLGYPSFSKNDDKIAFSALTTNDAEVVAAISLAQNKISGSGDAYGLINYAKWPVYFASGERTLGLAPVSDFTVDYKTGEAPLYIKYMDLSANSPTSWLWTFQGGNPSTSTQQNPVVNYSTAGTFKVTLTTQNNYGNNTNIKEAYITVTNPTGINDPEFRTVNCYPNPVIDILNIDCNSDFVTKILTVNGEVLLKNENERKLYLSGMKPGLYILEIKTQNGLFRQKLIKK